MSASRISRGSAGARIALVLLAVAVAATLGAGTRPSFDAYGWLDWGRMPLHGGLDTNAAPSWKPLPFLFTLLFGLFGRAAELRLWMILVTFVSLAGLWWGARLAIALADDPGRVRHGAGPDGSPRPGRPGASIPSVAAAALAVLGLLAVHDEYPFGYLHYVLSAQSDPMIVAFVLGAADCRRRERPAGAFGLLLLAALGRPEAWPFLLLAGAWLWRARPALRWIVVAGPALVAALWFGVPALTSRSWFVAADNAGASGYAPRGDAPARAATVLARALFQLPWASRAAATGAIALAVWRRQRTVLELAGAVLVWMAVEVGFGVHGWPALGRYMFEPVAVVIVLGASFVGRLLWRGSAARGSGPRAAAGLLAALGLIAGTAPALLAAGRREARDLRAQHLRTVQLDALARLVERLGPARLRACGEVISAGPGPGSRRHPSVGLGGQTALAFDVGENVDRVGYIVPQPGHPHDPVVIFHPIPGAGGWMVRTLRETRPGCRRLAPPAR